MSELNQEPALNEIIKSSQQKLDALKEESQPQAAAAPSVKRGRGRPFGTKKVKPQTESSSQAHGGGPLPHGAATVNPQIMRNFEVTPLASEVVKLPFDFIGASHGLDLTPTEEEAKTPANYLAKLIDSYLPSLDQRDPKTFNLIAFLISYALLAIKKVRVFANHKKAKTENKEQKENKSENTPQPQMRPIPKETLSASDFFRGGV